MWFAENQGEHLSSGSAMVEADVHGADTAIFVGGAQVASATGSTSQASALFLFGCALRNGQGTITFSDFAYSPL